MPIHYLYRSVSRPELVALYRAADVMLVTPLRDGMNLVAKEYVACQAQDPGVLVLSEFAGAAEELFNALIVPEMEAFAKQYGFVFRCHEIGHCNRKAGEERSFWTVETNFLPGRTFIKPSVITRCPGFRPSLIIHSGPTRSPTFTFSIATLLSSSLPPNTRPAKRPSCSRWTTARAGGTCACQTAFLPARNGSPSR